MLAWVIFNNGVGVWGFISAGNIMGRKCHIEFCSKKTIKYINQGNSFLETAKEAPCLLQSDSKVNLPDDTVWGIICFKEAWSRLART